MSKYDDVECRLATCVLCDGVKQGSSHHDAKNRIQIYLKTRRHSILVSRVVFGYDIDEILVCDAVLKAAKAMVVKLTFHADANNFELLVQILVVFQTIPFLD